MVILLAVVMKRTGSIFARPTISVNCGPEDKEPKPNGSGGPEKRGPNKISLWAYMPQPGTQKGAGGHYAIPNQIVRPIRARAQLRSGFTDNERFSGRFAELFETANGKGNRQAGESLGPKKTQRKEREEEESNQN